MKKIEMDKKLLNNLYWKQELTLDEISKIFKCTPTTIWRNLKQYNKIGTRGVINFSEKHKKRIKENHIDINGINNPFFGKHHTKEFKERMSEMKEGINIGKENPFYGKHHTEVTKKILSKKALGRKHTEEAKRKMRGRLPSHGKHIKYNNIWMRSSWEIKYAKYLDKKKLEWQYESKTFDLGNTTYTPDFYLPEHNLYIEIKGYWRDDAKIKFKGFKKQYPNIKIKLIMKPELQELGVL